MRKENLEVEVIKGFRENFLVVLDEVDVLELQKYQGCVFQEDDFSYGYYCKILRYCGVSVLCGEMF